MHKREFRKRHYRRFADLRRDLRAVMRERRRLRMLRSGETIDRAFQERLMLAVTEVNGCRYCAYAHAKMALASGLTQADVDALAGGSLEGSPPEQVPALLYAQHWAEMDAMPDPEVRQRVVETYGQAKTEAIELSLRMIRVGNLLGNTSDYLVHKVSFGLWGLGLLLMMLVAVTPACGSGDPTDGSTTAKTATAAPASTAAPGATAGATAGAAPTTTVTPPVSVTTKTAPSAISTDPRPPVTITVLYDNTTLRPEAKAARGFSCLVEGLEQTVLFDTGRNGDILLANMEALHVRPEAIDVVVLSHGHDDHTGGLAQFVADNADVAVYYPASSSAAAIGRAQATGASLAPVDAPVSICSGLIVTSPLGSPAESALLIDTRRGYVLVTGCAHPGIVEMVAAASALVGGPISTVLGGFHLVSHPVGQVEGIIQGLRELGVERCGPSHCTGEAATAQMRAAFGEGFIAMGVGAIIVL
jgi:7,8-dihydropterin-6-yl-methyl-4-(beta-D-ribofuranosyl)aminobenzene 5'-phosphate synthase